MRKTLFSGIVTLLAGLVIVSPASQLFAQSISTAGTLPRQGGHGGGGGGVTPITEQYAVAEDGTILTWEAFLAPTSGTHPNVLIVHGGGFIGDENGPQQLICAQDLAAAGMNAFIIQYRLAPPGMLPGQTSDGRFPDQTDDVLLAVHAARKDRRGNGKVGAIGGSAGGGHTVYVAATGTPGDDQIDAGVALSGSYNYGDQASWAWHGTTFYDSVTNYVNSTSAPVLTEASPIDVVKFPMPPLLLYASTNEAMPPQQITDLIAQLDALHVRNYQHTIFSGHGHAFAYWNKISSDVIMFLLGSLKP